MAAKKKKKVAIVLVAAPTNEAQQHGEFAYFKGRYQRVPEIDRLRARKQLDEREYQALAFYRDQAALAERSPLRSCLDDTQRGGGDIPLGAAITSAILATARMEREMGSLAPIARAVAVDDKSLTQWCVEKFGGRERLDGGGKLVAIVPAGEKRLVEFARLELRMAAHRIVA